jgi:arylsulfatase A-like enzyme
MIIAGPGLLKNTVVTNLTSLLDVFPTLVAMTGASPPSFLDGHSLFPLMSEPSSVTSEPLSIPHVAAPPTGVLNYIDLWTDT